MDVFQKYKSASYLRTMKGRTFLLEWDEDRHEIRDILTEFFENKKIRISMREIQRIIDETETHDIDQDFTARVVIQKGNFDKSARSIKSGVTVKLVFLMREFSEDKLRWYMYGLASGLFNNRSVLNVTKENQLGYTTYLALSDKDNESSKAVPSSIEKFRKKIANKAMHTTSA